MPHFHGGEIGGSRWRARRDATRPPQLAAVGYVSQDPETQVVSTTVAAEIDLPLEMRGDSEADRARAVEEVALALAIPHLLGRTVDTLSGGELQRVALAAALVTRPSLVLLDEPTSQLDPVAGDELIWLLRRLNEEWGVAVLLAEHRLERCLAAADRVVAMASGGIAFDGAPAEFLAWSHSDPPCRPPPLFPGDSPLIARSARSRAAPPGNPPIPRQGWVRRRCPPPGRGRPHGPLQAGLWVELERDEQPRRLRGIDSDQSRRTRRPDGTQRAGKSTPAAAAAGLIEPVAGKLEASGRDPC